MDMVGLVVGLIWLSALIAPLTIAWRDGTSIALALVIGLLLSFIVQFLAGRFFLNIWWEMVLIPGVAFEPNHLHRLITSGFLHGDVMHVIGNIMVIGLAGIPLEQRLGRERWIIIYLVGLLGGSIGWSIVNSDSFVPTLGASGAAFGLLGAYLACWPKDEIPFPLIIIRPWPVSLIALAYFGIELWRAHSVASISGSSGVAHMAHLTGFIATYSVARLVAKGGPNEPGVMDGGPSWNHIPTKVEKITDDPWSEPSPRLAHLLKKLSEEGDEVITRQAWLEEIATEARCPICDGELHLENLSLVCKGHLRWP